MNIDGKEYVDGSPVVFVTYTDFKHGFVIDPDKYFLRKIKKGILKLDLKPKVSKSFFSWTVGKGDVWFITDVININGTREDDYLLSEANILNENKRIDASKKHNILFLENDRAEKDAAERAISIQTRLQNEMREMREEIQRNERRAKGGTRKKRRKRKTRYIV